jgi:hypothetical protein
MKTPSARLQRRFERQFFVYVDAESELVFGMAGFFVDMMIVACCPPYMHVWSSLVIIKEGIFTFKCSSWL